MPLDRKNISSSANAPSPGGKASAPSQKSGNSGFSKSTRYKFCEDLEAFREVYQKKFKVEDGYGDFDDVSKHIVKSKVILFRTLYKIYSMKPFIEPIGPQTGSQDEVLEITFGITEDAKTVVATVPSLDDWIVDNKEIGIEFEKGFCTISVTPKEGQYGDCVMTVRVDDPVGTSQHSFDISFMERKAKKSKRKKKKNAGNAMFEDDGVFVDSDDESEEEERPGNARRWTVKQVGEFLFENNFANLRQTFEAEQVNGAELLKLDMGALESRFKIKKMKTKKQLHGWVEKLNTEADLIEYQEEQDKLAIEERRLAREKLQNEKQEAASRPNTSGSMGSSVMSLSRPGTAQSMGEDAWMSHAPSVYNRVCTDADSDAYIVGLELGKIEHLHQNILRDGIFVDLTSDDMRVCVSAALSTNFSKVIGIECRRGEFERGSVFLKRYKEKFLPSLPDDKRKQSVHNMAMEPLKYDGINKAKVVWLDWRQLREEFNKRQNRCYRIVDFENAMKWMPSSTMFLVVDDGKPYDEDSEDYAAAKKEPGNSLDRWTLVDSTVHEFSNGVATVYCYRHTGERHMIETKATYDDGFYSGESSEEEDYSSDEDSDRQQDYVDSLPKDKLKRYVQNMYEENESWTSFVNSSRQMLLSRGMNLSRGSGRLSMAQSRENLFKEKDPIVVRKWRSEYDPEYRRDFMGPSRSDSRAGGSRSGIETDSGKGRSIGSGNSSRSEYGEDAYSRVGSADAAVRSVDGLITRGLSSRGGGLVSRGSISRGLL